MPFGHANTKAAAPPEKCGHGSATKMIMQSSASHGAGMTEVDDMDWSELETWHHVVADPSPEVAEWLHEVPGGRCYYTFIGNFWFERLEDQVLFKLTWCK